jgi:DNA-binding transcriptional LysR family regulator
VARHRGISAALPHIGYSIQQPALSEQMLQLEEAIGQKLFIRHPFALTPAGETLVAELEPGLQRLFATLNTLQAPPRRPLRIGAPDVAVSQFLPPLTAKLQREFPALGFEFVADDDAALLRRLATGDLDLVISTERPTRATGLSCRTLLRLPLALLLPGPAAPRDAADVLLSQRPRLCAVENGPVWHHFAAGLKSRGLEWRPLVTATSFSAVPFLVASGMGVGLGLQLEALTAPHRLTALSLPAGFAPIEVVLLHPPRPEIPVKRLADEITHRAAKMET